MLHEFMHNVLHNLFKPLLLFFYLGFLAPLLKVPFEFPKVLYQGLTIYLLLAIGWHGGEELASLKPNEFFQAGGFMVIGFVTNFLIGIVAYLVLRSTTKLRKIDAATVAGYYGSDSAGTFVTCVGVLVSSQIMYAQYMPVMLAVMEIPGCLVALTLVSRLRNAGMDSKGNMPGEPDYVAVAEETESRAAYAAHDEHDGHEALQESGHARYEGSAGGTAVAVRAPSRVTGTGGHGPHDEHRPPAGSPRKPTSVLSPKVMHEVFLNPGLFLLFGGILIGFVSRLQGEKVTAPDDQLFVVLFQGLLCLFLLEMGMTACQRLRDLRTAGLPFVLFALIAPNIFATIAILVAHTYAHVLGVQFPLGTYPLFAVLAAAASYIAVPAIQRIAIPESSPTLPLAASLGVTFSYNVTIGIPVYIMISKAVIAAWPIAA